MPLTQPATARIVATAYVVVMAGTTLPGPLYPTLQRMYGLSTAAATQLFAIYAVTVLAGLILFGSLSDRYGRRPLLWAGTIAAAGSGVLYVTAVAAPMLYVARSLSGVSAALMTGTATAFLVDTGRTPRRGAGTASVANALGLGVGPLLAAAVAVALPQAPLAPFAVHAALCAVCCALLGRVQGHPHFRPRRGWLILPAIPTPARRGFAVGLLASVGFAVMGAVTAISAIALTNELHISSILIIGAIGSLGFLATAVGQSVGRMLGGGWLLVGYGLLILGVALLLTAAAGVTGLAGVACGLAVAGLGHGILFSRGLELSLRKVPEYFRARASTAYWCVAYGLTAIGAVAVGGAGSLWGITIGVESVYSVLITIAAITMVIAIALSHRYDVMSIHKRSRLDPEM